MYAKQEAVWDREKAAREKLMQGVLAERRGQMQAKAATLRTQREQSLRQRKDLVRLIETEKMATARDVQTRRDDITERKAELDDQLAARVQRRLEEENMATARAQQAHQEEEERRAIIREEEARRRRNFEETSRATKSQRSQRGVRAETVAGKANTIQLLRQRLADRGVEVPPASQRSEAAAEARPRSAASQRRPRGDDAPAAAYSHSEQAPPPRDARSYSRAPSTSPEQMGGGGGGGGQSSRRRARSSTPQGASGGGGDVTPRARTRGSGSRSAPSSAEGRGIYRSDTPATPIPRSAYTPPVFGRVKVAWN